MATAYLSRTQDTGSTDAAKKFTVSLWIKRGGLGVSQVMWSSGSGASAGLDLYFDTNDNLCFEALDGSDNPKIISDREFRDVGAWYHIVAAIDTPQATPADTVKLYVNGVQETSFSTASYPAQDYVFSIGTTSDTMKVGTGTMAGATNYWNGNMAHLHYTDGQVYAASNFGSTDATSGIWVPNSAPSVTYGNNGLFLKFASGALGTDSSGNANTMAATGTLTATKDNAMNNFCTLNPLDNYLQSMTYSQGNNTIVTDYASPATATVGVATGKWYWECKAVASSGGDFYTGVRSTQVTDANAENGYRANDWSYYGPTGNYLNNNTDTSYGNSYTVGDIIGVALDITNSKLYFSKGGVWQNSGVPTSGGTGTGAISITAVGSTPLGFYTPAAGGWSSSVDYTWSFNFGNGYFGTTAVSSSESDDAGEGSFEYDVPAGYYAICTNNLGDQS